jgi:hypothetical protein
MTSAGRPRRDGDAVRPPRVVPRSGPDSITTDFYARSPERQWCEDDEAESYSDDPPITTPLDGTHRDSVTALHTIREHFTQAHQRVALWQPAPYPESGTP